MSSTTVAVSKEVKALLKEIKKDWEANQEMRVKVSDRLVIDTLIEREYNKIKEKQNKK
ncbi:hypothetical protein [Enterococcus sp. AZ152]|uniref:hypothetical protein n=1 Tax=Enterococcus sp. AZ152 TaxID=2774848 RepID=UPI003F248542